MDALPPTDRAVPAVSIVGPAPRFRLEGRSLQLGPRNDEVAVYRDGHWHSDGRTFTVLESESPTLLRFEANGAAPEVRGPFGAVQVSEGVIRAGHATKQVLAVLDEHTGLWRLSPGWKGYSAVVLAPAVPSAPPADDSDAEFSADDFIRTDHSQSRPSYVAEARTRPATELAP